MDHELLQVFFRSQGISTSAQEFEQVLISHLGGSPDDTLDGIKARTPGYHFRNRILTACTALALLETAPGKTMGARAAKSIAIALNYPTFGALVKSVEHEFPFPYTTNPDHLAELERYFGVMPVNCALAGIAYKSGAQIIVNEPQMVNRLISDELSRADLAGSKILLVGAENNDPLLSCSIRVGVNNNAITKVTVKQLQQWEEAKLSQWTSVILSAQIPELNRISLYSSVSALTNVVVCKHPHESFQYTKYTVYVGRGLLPEHVLERYTSFEQTGVRMLFGGIPDNNTAGTFQTALHLMPGDDLVYLIDSGGVPLLQVYSDAQAEAS